MLIVSPLHHIYRFLCTLLYVARNRSGSGYNNNQSAPVVWWGCGDFWT